MDKNKKQKINIENEKIALLESQLKKALSDYSNLEKDTNRRVEAMIIAQKMLIVRQMLDVLDSLHLAIKAKDTLTATADVKSWIEGVVGMLSQIDKIIEEIGAKKIIMNKRDAFDSNTCEAVGMVNEGEKGKILEVVASGYTINDFVIRPAKVIVSNGVPIPGK
ncbi:nucleotide exchange factor GrpE [Candidatus Dojkabacteria bacterium]|jgi:molecular chaperone GrpE|nr:nucleotide exchange factor GrpE [Candidatus Dojkabacteria bacterium]